MGQADGDTGGETTERRRRLRPRAVRDRPIVPRGTGFTPP